MPDYHVIIVFNALSGIDKIIKPTWGYLVVRGRRLATHPPTPGESAVTGAWVGEKRGAATPCRAVVEEGAGELSAHVSGNVKDERESDSYRGHAGTMAVREAARPSLQRRQ